MAYAKILEISEKADADLHNRLVEDAPELEVCSYVVEDNQAKASSSDPPSAHLCLVCKGNAASKKTLRWVVSKRRTIERFIGVDILDIDACICQKCDVKLRRLQETVDDWGKTAFENCVRLGGKAVPGFHPSSLDNDVYDFWRKTGAAQGLTTDKEIATFFVKQYQKQVIGFQSANNYNNPVLTLDLPGISLPFQLAGNISQNLPSVQLAATSQNLPSVQLAATSQNLTSVQLAATSQNLTSVQLAATSQNLPSVQLAATSQNLPSVKLAATSQNLTSVQLAATSQNLTSVQLAATSQNLPSVQLAATSQNLPSVKLAATSQNLPRPQQAGALHNLPKLQLVETSQSLPKPHLAATLQNLRKPHTAFTASIPASRGLYYGRDTYSDKGDSLEEALVTVKEEEDEHGTDVGVVTSHAAVKSDEQSEGGTEQKHEPLETRCTSKDEDDFPPVFFPEPETRRRVEENGFIYTVINGEPHIDHPYFTTKQTRSQSWDEESEDDVSVQAPSRLREQTLMTKKKPVFLLPKSLVLHPCHLCFMMFTSGPQLEEHKKTHTQARSLKQPETEKTGMKAGKVEAANVAPQLFTKYESGKYACNTCTDTFDDEEIFRKHEKVHADSGRSYVCNICWKPITSSHNLCFHMTAHNREPIKKKKKRERFACAYCDKVFTRKGFVKDHMKVHSTDRPYECDLCSLRFRWKNNMRRHRLLHLGKGPKPHMCDTCGKLFYAPIGLRDHMKTHTGERPFVCDRCGKGFINKMQLRVHLELRHGDKSWIEGSQVVCEACGESFSNRTVMASHSCKAKRKIPQKQPLEPWEISLKCRVCDKKMASLDMLRRHYNRLHTDSEARRHVCSVCGKAFFYLKDYNSHTAMHSGEKPFACAKCGLAWKTKTRWRYHMAVTHEGKTISSKSFKQTYPCSVCGQEMANPTSLKMHMMRHTGERPHVCELCGATFRHKDAYNQHVTVTHNPGVRPYSCTTCGNTYRSAYGLRLHKRSKHGASAPILKHSDPAKRSEKGQKSVNISAGTEKEDLRESKKKLVAMHRACTKRESPAKHLEPG